jgi:hypothetical protein
VFFWQASAAPRAVFSLAVPSTIIGGLTASLAKNSISDVQIRNDYDNRAEQQNERRCPQAENYQNEKACAVRDSKPTVKPALQFYVGIHSKVDEAAQPNENRGNKPNEPQQSARLFRDQRLHV